MDSTNALPLSGQAAAPRTARWLAVWRAAWKKVAGLAAPGDEHETDRRSRAIMPDPRRLAALAFAASLLAASGAWWWTARTHQQAADDSARAALKFLDRRLDAIDVELNQVARRATRAAATDGCSEALTTVLLAQSLQSSLVRRFDVVHVGTPLRCEPGGERLGLPLDDMPPAGLSIVPGSQLGARPTVLRPLGGSAVLQATLDPYALQLPRNELPAHLREFPLRIVAQSPPAGALPIRDVRSNPGSSQPALTATASSSVHNIGVLVQIDRSDLSAVSRQHALAAVIVALLAVAGIAGLAWRRALRRARLLNRIERALKKRQFEPFVQPIVDLGSGRCVGAEVLMRWNHPQRGILAPVEFIAEAERSGLIVPMSNLVMARAAHRLASISRLRPELYFSFNVTPLQLRQPDFMQRLEEVFRDDTLARERVLLELTERDFVDPDTRRALAKLHASGWRMAIDDFGTGHSSLASLENLAIDRIKIDRAFVRTIDERTVARPVLDAIIGLASHLGVPLIAEGVETRSQWDYLAARGVRHAQGFLMARPMPIDAFAAWLAERNQVAVESPVSDTTGPLAGDDCVLALWHQMRLEGGLQQRDRRYRLKVYPNCFVGHEAVDWITQRTGVSRAGAVRIGQRLLALDLIRHVADEHDFEDAMLFYRISAQPSQRSEPGVPQDLRQALKGESGVRLRDIGRGLILHRACARGRDIVDWMVARHAVPRSTAREWAAHLMRIGALRHVFDDRPFSDDDNLFKPL